MPGLIVRQILRLLGIQREPDFEKIALAVGKQAIRDGQRRDKFGYLYHDPPTPRDRVAAVIYSQLLAYDCVLVSTCVFHGKLRKFASQAEFSLYIREWDIIRNAANELIVSYQSLPIGELRSGSWDWDRIDAMFPLLCEAIVLSTDSMIACCDILWKQSQGQRASVKTYSELAQQVDRSEKIMVEQYDRIRVLTRLLQEP